VSSMGQTNPMAAVAGVGTIARPQAVVRPHYFRLLTILFLLSLPLVNPWVRGDGVGYYAYVRSLLIDHDLHFDDEWLAANSSFLQGRTDSNGHLLPTQYSPTGYVKNHFSIGPSILWVPFLLGTHGAVLLLDRLGAHIPADGYSPPYLITMAAATALYGFLGLLLSFSLARYYFDERWALLATLGIWCGSSLLVYMYFNPSWSHAHSAFAVALFLWYWHRTRVQRTLPQWLLLGLCAGLMADVYYPNAILLLVPGTEAIVQYREILLEQAGRLASLFRLLRAHALFMFVTCLGVLPTFIVHRIIYGNAFESDYPPLRNWFWTSPVLLRVLFSADHGMLSWTPILIPAILGLIPFLFRDRIFGTGLLLSFLAYYYFIASYPDWDGISSFGNRFFVSLTPVFVLGLAAFLDFVARRWAYFGNHVAVAACVTGLLILWNGSFVLQWGTNMIPTRGPISWGAMVHNQYEAVPERVGGELRRYFWGRKAMMQHIEERDLNKLKSK